MPRKVLSLQLAVDGQTIMSNTRFSVEGHTSDIGLTDNYLYYHHLKNDQKDKAVTYLMSTVNS